MKKSTLVIIGVLAMSLTACGGTTGGLAKSMAKKAAMNKISSAPAPDSAPVSVAPPVLDGMMDCTALAKDIRETDAIIAAANKTLGNSGQADLAGQLAATGASQAALHSGAANALAKVPFGGLFAKKAMDSAANAGRKKAEKAKADLRSAQLRKASLSGLYTGKNCAS